MTTFLGEPIYTPRRKTPSFSSSLLDAIYRSIDEPEVREHDLQANSMRMKRQVDYEEEAPSLRRAIMIEKWIEDRGNSTKVSTKSTFKKCNGSSSSDSSCCGTIFSSTDTESGIQKSSSFHTMQTPKSERKFISTTKTRALQIYSDLKKVKQPISPGGRIASILNSIFSSKTVKKSKLNENLNSVSKSRSLKDLTTTSPFSTSPFSRNCLTETPISSRSKRNSGLKRAVRFSPVIVDDDSRPSDQKKIYIDDSRILSFPIVKKKLTEKKNYSAKPRECPKYRGFLKADEDYEDDIASCSSSDLFELDNIETIGVGVYAEELPVYCTTNLKTNKAIANGHYIF